MNEFVAMIRRIGALRLAAVIGVGAGVALALTLRVARIAEPQLGVLYAEIDLADAKGVIDRLDQEKIRYETRERGGKIAILAPQSEIPRLRMSMAADGATPEGGVGYEIFDKEDAFGATSFQQNINRLRALEGELARTISSISGVRSARVHLVLPERALFARDRQEASASIVVDTKTEIDQRTVRAIINLVASAVPGLSTSNVTVLDAAGDLLASGHGSDGPDGGAAEKTAATEARLRRTLEDILGRVVGADNLRVQVAADMDFNKVTENAEIIDPDSQTVLSSTTVEEAANDSDPAAARGVTVANALPGAETERQDLPASTSSNRRTEETTNYEMSRTTRTEVREQGVVKRLSVAVALNARAESPRTPEELKRLESLARSAVGYNEARGDKVEVVEVAFQPAGATAAAAGAAGTPATASADPGRIAEIGALALIGFALVVFVLRPMFRAARGRAGPPALARASEADGVAAVLSDGAAAQPRLPERRIDIAQVAGQVKASSISKVAEVVKGHTEESASILKGWIRQTS